MAPSRLRCCDENGTLSCRVELHSGTRCTTKNSCVARSNCPRRHWIRPAHGLTARVVVKDGAIVGEGLNQSAKNFDPTSHGEVEAVRDACRKLKTTDLTGCDLYTSCEPCSVCVATMIMAGIGRMYYGASLEQSAAVVPRPPLPPPTTLVRQH